MNRLFSTALGGLFSVSVYGQKNMLLYEATRDSIIGESERYPGQKEIWHPSAKYGGRSEISFEFALFTAIEQIINNYCDTTYVDQIYDPYLGKQRSYNMEYVLSNLKGDTIKLKMNHFVYGEGFITDIGIISDNILVASYTQKFHQSNLLDKTSTLGKQNNIINPDYYLVRNETRLDSEGVYLTESYISVTCNFKCIIQNYMK